MVLVRPSSGQWERLMGVGDALAAFFFTGVLAPAVACRELTATDAGIVFGYIDEENFWVKIYKRSAIQKIRVYQVSGGTWNVRSTTGASITNGTPFTMETHTYGYSTDLAVAGQVGLWCSDDSDNEFDDFQVRDIAGPFEVDGRWFASDGGVTVDDADNNVLKFPSDNPYEMLAIRRGFRGDEFVATYKFKWNATSWPGVVVRWLNPREFLTVWLSPDDGKAYLYRQTADRAEEEFVAVSSSGVTLTSGQWYDAKVVVHDDTLDVASLRQGQVGNQVLDFYVDANQDSDFLDAGRSGQACLREHLRRQSSTGNLRLPMAPAMWAVRRSAVDETSATTWYGRHGERPLRQTAGAGPGRYIPRPTKRWLLRQTVGAGSGPPLSRPSARSRSRLRTRSHPPARIRARPA